MTENATQSVTTPDEMPPQTEVSELARQADEYLNGWKRAQADLINYKKEESRRMGEFAKYSNESLILDLLDILLNLELAAKHIANEGLDGVVKQFNETLKKHGVERIAVAGQAFDPEVHEAAGVIDESHPLIEIRPGFSMYGKVIRPSRVNNG